MYESATSSVDVVGALNTPAGSVQLVDYHFRQPARGGVRGDGKFRVELCLSARHRTARACFREQWKEYRFEPMGGLFVVHPNADLIVRSDEVDDMTAIVCELQAQPLMSMFDTIPEPTDALLMAALNVRNERVRSLLAWTAEEIRHPGFASTLLAEMMCGQLAVELYRHGEDVADRERDGGLSAWRLRLIDERLKDVAPAPTSTELAELCRLSVRQLARGFRTSRGCSLGQYVVRCQIEHAKYLLSQGVGVGIIAGVLGFSSSSSFCFAFRRETGYAPKQYRQRLM